MKREEEILQAKCYEWFHNFFHSERGCLFHVDNNSYNRIIGAKKKTLGVVAGVSDLVWVRPDGRVLWIECKTDKGAQGEAQIDFQNMCASRGHKYIVFRSFEEFQNIIYDELRSQ